MLLHFTLYLHCDIPANPTKSFVRGTVTAVLNDSVFQTSTPFRHAVALVKEVESMIEKPSILMKFSDGGTDQRNTLESVKCSLICVFKELDLDLLVAARCAPGQSWTNPAERVMSILNIGLQNVSLERTVGDESFESAVGKCSSMDKLTNSKDFKDAWHRSVAPCISTIENRFSRLTLKDKPIQIGSPIETFEIEHIQRHLTTLFPDLDISKLTKLYTNRCTNYLRWLDIHCIQRQYVFQICKCTVFECCGATKTPREQLDWLPDPMLDPDNVGHYQQFSKLYNTGVDTSEDARPSLRNASAPGTSKTAKVKASGKTSSKIPVNNIESLFADDQSLYGEASVYTAQKSQAIVHCVDCIKPRIIYLKSKLTNRQKVQLAMGFSEYEYSSGSPAIPPSHSLAGKIFTQLNLTCESNIEVTYYSAAIARIDLCCYCAAEEITADQELKKKFKTVLPVCELCKQKNLVPCLRPYGKLH